MESINFKKCKKAKKQRFDLDKTSLEGEKQSNNNNNNKYRKKEEKSFYVSNHNKYKYNP